MGRVLAGMLDQRDQRRVAQRPHAVAAGHAHEPVGLDAAPLHVEAERRHQPVRSVADGGDDGAGRDDAAVGQLDCRAGRRLGADAGQDLDAVDGEPPRRVFGEVGGKARQDAVGVFDQIEANLVGVDVVVIFQRAADQLAHLGDGLDAREAGSHRHEGEELPLHLRVVGHVGRFEAADDVGAQAVRVGQVLHGERVLGQSREAVEVDAGAERDDELVVMEIDRHAPRALHDDHLLLGEVDAHDLGLADLEPVQQLAERHDRVGGMDR